MKGKIAFGESRFLNRLISVSDTKSGLEKNLLINNKYDIDERAFCFIEEQ